MEYLGTIYKGSQSDIIFPVPFIELSDGATVDFYTDGDGVFSRAKDEIKIDNYMLRTTASADELNSLNDGVLNYTINTCMGKSEGDTGLYLSEPTSYVDKQYLTADGVKTINGESIVGQGNIEIQGGGSEDYVWEWNHTPYFTGNTNFSEEELQSVIDAHNNGKNIIIKHYDLFIYPSLVSVHKEETILTISYMYNGDTYAFEYDSVGQSQTLSKKDTSDTYVVSVDGENSLNNLTLTKDEIINLMAAVQANKNIILTNNEITFHVIKTNISNIIFQISYGFTAFSYYKWTVSLNDYEVNVDSQKTVAYPFQSQLGSNSWLNLKDLNLKKNKGVDNILTNLKSSTETTNNNINELSGNVETVQAKDVEQDKRIDTIESYAKESLGNLDALSGSVQNNYYTKTQCDKQYEVIGYSYSKKEVDGKIPTSTSQLTNDSGYLTEHQSLEEYYTKAESDTNYASKTDTYTKAESDTNYASKSDTYTKGETYSKSEIDTKIGDINNILESI